VYGPNRVGSGRIDAAAALRNQVLAYAEAGSGVVTASFGVVEVDQEQVSATKTITVANKGTSAAVYRVTYDALVDQPGVRYALSAQRLTVPPGQSRTVTVTMTATQDQLLKVADPTVVTDDGRQFLGEASGRVVLAPTNNRGETLRVPVHANPKPSSTLQATPSEDGSTITLAGEGVANGDLFEPTSYTSLVSGFEQLGTSPEMPRCTAEPATTCYKSELERSVDLASVGVASDALQYDDAGLYFAVASHGTETTPLAPISTSIVLDATGDGVWDYLVTTTSVTGQDLPLVVIADREGNLVGPGGVPYVAPLNIYDGLVDTNVFDSDVKVFGVPLSALPEVTGRITFGVQSTSYTGTVDDVGTVTGPDGQVELAPQAMSFDPTAPGLSFTADGESALMVPATDGTQLAVTQDAASYAADTAVGGDKGAMVVLSQNSGAAGRTQSVPVAPGADATVTTTPPAAPPADSTPVEPTTPPDQQVTEPPAAPATDAPATDAPATDAPAAEAPATETPPAG
jgi:hypothetical protein